MVELGFSVDDAARVEHAAVPTLRFSLGVSAEVPVRSVLLDVQVQIAARRRGYDAARARPAVRALRAGRGLGDDAADAAVDADDARRAGVRGARRSSAWTCRARYDLEVTASRYLDALTDGDVPLEFLFSGSVFYDGRRAAADDAAVVGERGRVRLPVRVWKETMERYFRGTAWVRLSKEAFDRLSAYKSRNALATWDDALDGARA